MMTDRSPTSGDPLELLRYELEKEWFPNLGTFGRSAIQTKLDLLWELSAQRGGNDLDFIRQEYSILAPLVAQ